MSWSPPALRDRNGVLKSYLFSVNRDGVSFFSQMTGTHTNLIMIVTIHFFHIFFFKRQHQPQLWDTLLKNNYKLVHKLNLKIIFKC